MEKEEALKVAAKMLNKLLKEKGFNEPCQYFYKLDNNVIYRGTVFTNTQIGDIFYNAPTLQMAMKWLREEYDIFIDVGYDDLDFYWLIESIATDVPIQDRPKLLKNGTAGHKTYEEAVEAALKYSLENLI